MTLDLVVRIAKVFDGDIGPDTSDLFWSTDEVYAPLTIFANCNDLFYWAAADAEEITEGNIDILEQSLRDLQTSRDYSAPMFAHLLFCCRVRKMRPQGACYAMFPKDTWHFFDECGEPRAVGLGNPMEREEHEKNHD